MNKLKLIIINFIVSCLGLDEEISRLDKKIESLRSDILRAEREIIKRTDVSVDPAIHGAGISYVFVAGRYKGADYVRLFQIPPNDLHHIIEQLKNIEKMEYGRTRYIDRDFSGVSAIIKNEVQRR